MSPVLNGLSVIRFSFPLSRGGDEGVRTPDPLRARQVLSQLSYTPIDKGSIFHLFEDLFFDFRL